MFQNKGFNLSPDSGMGEGGGSLGSSRIYKTSTIEVPAQPMSIIYGTATLKLNHALGKGEVVTPKEDVPFAISNESFKEFAKGLGGSLDLSKIKLGKFGAQLLAAADRATMSLSAVSRALYADLRPEGQLPTKASIILASEDKEHPIALMMLSMFRPTIAQQLSQPDPHFKIDGSEETGAPTISYRTDRNPLRMDSIYGPPDLLKESDLFRVGIEVDNLVTSVLSLDGNYSFEVTPAGSLSKEKNLNLITQRTAHAVGLLFRYLLTGADGFPGAKIDSARNRLELSIPAFKVRCHLAMQLAPHTAVKHTEDGSQFFKALKDRVVGLKILTKAPMIDPASDQVGFKIEIGKQGERFYLIPRNFEKTFMQLVLDIAAVTAPNQEVGIRKCGE